MNASYILHLDDDTLIVLDGSLFKDGASFKSAFKSLDARVKHNTSLIQPEKQESLEKAHEAVSEQAPEAVPEQAPEAVPEQAPDVDTAKATVESAEKS